VKDVSVDTDSKTGLKDICSRKEAWPADVSLFVCACVCLPSFKTKFWGLF